MGHLKLKLHEAMVVALIGMPNRTGTYQQVLEVIKSRELYRKRNGEFPAPSQLRMRATLCNGQYHHLFEEINSQTIRLRKQ